MRKYNIYRRRDGRYEGRLTRGKRHSGKRRFLYFFGHSQKEVEEKIDSCRNSEQTEICSKTIGELFDEWYQSILHCVKESTAANYHMKAEKHVLPAFSTVSASKISASDIYAFINEKQSCGLSNRYISDIIIMMKTLFKYASRIYHFLNPMENITLPKLQKLEIDLLDKQQQPDLQQYIAENPSNTTLGIALSMSTGIRIGELCALQWEDIDLKKRILTVRKTMQRIQTPHETIKTKLIITEPKSESSKREIPIPECIVNLLYKFKGKDKEYIIYDIAHGTFEQLLGITEDIHKDDSVGLRTRKIWVTRKDRSAYPVFHKYRFITSAVVYDHGYLGRDLIFACFDSIVEHI